MKFAILFSGLIFAAISTTGKVAWAQASTTNAELYDYVYKLQVDENGRLKFNVWRSSSGYNFVNTGCNDPATFVVTDSTLTDDKVKAWLQLALTSYISHTAIWVWTKAHVCTTDGFPILDSLMIQSQQ
jgi:hypothetical protein